MGHIVECVTLKFVLFVWLVLSSIWGAFSAHVVSFTQVEKRLMRFTHDGAQNFSQLLLDEDGHQLIVGGRDFIFRLSLDSLESFDSHEWSSSTKTISECVKKGRSPEDCHNYITILHRDNGSLLVCGTNSFAPLCRRYSPHDLSRELSEESGVTKSPYSPAINTTTTMTSSGDLFVGTSIGFGGSDHVFLRSGPTQHLLRTPQSSQEYLNRPDFIASFEIGDFIYFFFREQAVEYMRCGQAAYSRVARVCKDDAGGGSLMRQSWTTFLKARLNCSLPSAIPFYYNEAQSVDYLAAEQTFYVSFTTAENSIYGSAVCAYTLNDIEATFSGPLTGNRRNWKQGRALEQSLERLQCGRNRMDLSSEELVDLKEYQQAFYSVPSSPSMPLYHSQLERLVHLQVDEVSTVHQGSVQVVFVVTLEGVLKKIVRHPGTDTNCVVEVLQPFDDGEKLNRLRLVKEQNALYAATDRGVLKLPLSYCEQYSSQQACIDAGDPYCGWHKVDRRCAAIPRDDANALLQQTDIWEQGRVCAVLSSAVNGSWGRWSDWKPCDLSSEAPNEGQCLCRQRKCDAPAPGNGGRFCEGHDLQVTNCTQHGGWTDWSEWSACDRSCGQGHQNRTRTCSNPRPAFGGRNCTGSGYEERGCPDNPLCHPTKAMSKEGVDGTELHGGGDSRWSEWGPWSSCSVPCGGGYQTRQRTCTGKARSCELGCSKEYRLCHNQECQEVRGAPEWSDWLVASERSADSSGGDADVTINGSAGAAATTTMTAGGWLERRFRYQCVARVPYATSMRLVLSKEERLCRNRNECPDSAALQLPSATWSWSSWSAWGPCSVPCGGGVQRRERTCKKGSTECPGHSIEEQACNIDSCPIEGWSEWSQWSACDDRGEQHRGRHCIATEQWRCLGGAHTGESRSCLLNDSNAVLASIEKRCSGAGVAVLWAAVIVAYLVGVATMIVIVRMYNKRSEDQAFISGGRTALSESMQTLPKVPKRLGSLPLVPVESNTYVPTSAFKTNQFSTLQSQASTPVKGSGNTATIKRSNTFRAQIGDDQNF